MGTFVKAVPTVLVYAIALVNIVGLLAIVYIVAFSPSADSAPVDILIARVGIIAGAIGALSAGILSAANTIGIQGVKRDVNGQVTALSNAAQAAANEAIGATAAVNALHNRVNIAIDKADVAATTAQAAATRIEEKLGGAV